MKKKDKKMFQEFQIQMNEKKRQEMFQEFKTLRLPLWPLKLLSIQKLAIFFFNFACKGLMWCLLEGSD